jgi:hypothetical protein
MENEQPKKRKRLTAEEQYAKEAAKEKKAKEKKRVIGKKLEGKKTKRINKQKFLVGSAMLDEAESDPNVKKFLYGLLNRFLTREYDRSFFSDKDTDPFVLPPLADKGDVKKEE